MLKKLKDKFDKKKSSVNWVEQAQQEKVVYFQNNAFNKNFEIDISSLNKLAQPQLIDAIKKYEKYLLLIYQKIKENQKEYNSLLSKNEDLIKAKEKLEDKSKKGEHNTSSEQQKNIANALNFENINQNLDDMELFILSSFNQTKISFQSLITLLNENINELVSFKQNKNIDNVLMVEQIKSGNYYLQNLEQKVENISNIMLDYKNQKSKQQNQNDGDIENYKQQLSSFQKQIEELKIKVENEKNTSKFMSNELTHISKIMSEFKLENEELKYQLKTKETEKNQLQNQLQQLNENKNQNIQVSQEIFNENAKSKEKIELLLIEINKQKQKIEEQEEQIKNKINEYDQLTSKKDKEIEKLQQMMREKTIELENKVIQSRLKLDEKIKEQEKLQTISQGRLSDMQQLSEQNIKLQQNLCVLEQKIKSDKQLLKETARKAKKYKSELNQLKIEKINQQQIQEVSIKQEEQEHSEFDEVKENKSEEFKGQYNQLLMDKEIQLQQYLLNVQKLEEQITELTINKNELMSKVEEQSDLIQEKNILISQLEAKRSQGIQLIEQLQKKQQAQQAITNIEQILPEMQQQNQIEEPHKDSLTQANTEKICNLEKKISKYKRILSKLKEKQEKQLISLKKELEGLYKTFLLQIPNKQNQLELQEFMKIEKSLNDSISKTQDLLEIYQSPIFL